MYHEYTKPNGRLYHKHHNGRTIRESINLKPENFPNGPYWREAAETKALELAGRLSPEKYEAWCDSLPDRTTWKDIYEDLVKILSDLDNCTCREDKVMMVCPNCRAVIQQTIGDEIPVEE